MSRTYHPVRFCRSRSEPDFGLVRSLLRCLAKPPAARPCRHRYAPSSPTS